MDNSLPNLTNLENLNNLAYDNLNPPTNNYYYDYQTGYNSSSNSSTLPLGNEFNVFTNQQNLVSSVNDSKIPSFCEAFIQNEVENRDQSLNYYLNNNHNHNNHQTNHLNNHLTNHNNHLNNHLNNRLTHHNNHLNNHLTNHHNIHHNSTINNSISNSISSTSSSNSTNLSMNQSINHYLNPINQSSIDQPINNQTNHNFNFQSSFARSNANPQDNGYQFLSTPEPHLTDCSINNFKENINKFDAFDTKQLDQFDEPDKKVLKREINNDRERNRVRKMNEGFNNLGKICGLLLKEDAKMTKLAILEKSYMLINDLESKVMVSDLQIKNVLNFLNLIF